MLHVHNCFFKVSGHAYLREIDNIIKLTDYGLYTGYK